MIKLITTQTKLTSVYARSSIDEVYKYFESKSEISFDSETTGFDPHTGDFICVQLGDFDTQFVIDCTTIKVELLKDLLESGKTIIFQNAQFDLRFLLKHSIDIKTIYDTFLAELILTTGYEHKDRKSEYFASTNLAEISKKYTGVYLDKSIRGIIHKVGLTEAVIEYGAKDVKYLGKIKRKQLELIEENELDNILDLENKVVRVFALMAYNGITLDSKRWLNVSKITENNVDTLTKELDNIVLTTPSLSKFVPQGVQQNLFGFEERLLDINWSSPIQKVQILRELGFNLDTVGFKELQRHKNMHILIAKLIEFSKQEKLANAFGKAFLKFINKNTGRLHMSVWQVLATGRISVSDPNLNQIPRKGTLGKEIRSCFIPRKGYKMVGGDYSSFELAIIAELSEDPLWINTLLEGKNLHSVLCAATFNIPVEDVEKPFPYNPSSTYRDVQKIINFGLAYGMSEFKLADTINVSIDTAKQIINDFFKIVPKVKSFLDLLGNLGKTRGYIRSAPPYRRIRWFPEWKEDIDPKRDFKILGSIERKSKNMPIQGCNGDIIKQALINVQEEIDINNWPVNILLSIYDEIQTECREDIAEQWKIKLEQIMENTAKTVLKKVPIKADCSISDYWTK